MNNVPAICRGAHLMLFFYFPQKQRNTCHICRIWFLNDNPYIFHVVCHVTVNLPPSLIETASFLGRTCIGSVCVIPIKIPNCDSSSCSVLSHASLACPQWAVIPFQVSFASLNNICVEHCLLRAELYEEIIFLFLSTTSTLRFDFKMIWV